MIVLGIESATESVGVALAASDGVLASVEVARGRRHAESIVPCVQFVCERADIELSEVGAIAVDVGPGLFTGMRVGIATAKSLAMALNIPMVPMTSLEVLAAAEATTDDIMCLLLMRESLKSSGRCTGALTKALNSCINQPSGQSTIWSQI